MYIGKTPTVGNFQVCDAISVVNGQAAYTLQVGGVNVAPESANHMLVSLNGILQKPGSSFTISGSTMTFASNLATGDVIDFVQILGNVLDIGQPSDDTVTAAKINNDVISGQTALTSAPADTDEFLVSDAGTIKRIDYSLIKGSTATAEFSAYVSSDVTVNDTTDTVITFNTELFDTDGVYNTSNGRFTAPSDGKYFLAANVWSYDAQSKITAQNISFYINGSEKLRNHFISDNLLFQKFDSQISTILNLSQDDYVQVYMYINTTDSGSVAIESSSGVYQNTFFGFRLPT